ncbi:DUF3231 family protein [Ammoniphilus resinae]
MVITSWEGHRWNKKKVPLTASEISNLWTSYQANSMSICVLKYFSATAQDLDIKSVIEFALGVAEKQYHDVKEIFRSEGVAIPLGFTEDDVDVNAPRLLSDAFALEYVKHMASIGMMTYSAALYISTRADVRECFHTAMISTIELDKKSTEVLLDKGIYMRPPYINLPEKVDFVKDQSFLSGWFGERRPITGLEITNLFINMITNSLGKALIMGFSQVVQSKDIRKYLIRGKQISTKQLSVFGSILKDEDVDTPRSWESHVTDSTIPPFSDKLMLFHVVSLIASGIGNYGVALSTSPRKDIAAHYARLLSEIALYAEDGANLMIKHGWMEEPPRAADRKALV